MRSRITSIATLVVGLIAFGAMHAMSATAAQSADCGQGSAEEKVAA